MKMKRMFAAAVALALFCTGLAFAQEETQEDDWYLETASELARCVGELAGDEAYMQMMTSNPFDILAPLQEADFASVIGAWRIRIGEGMISLMGTLDGMSQTGRESLNSKMPSAILNQWNAYVSAEAVAASTMRAHSPVRWRAGGRGFYANGGGHHHRHGVSAVPGGGFQPGGKHRGHFAGGCPADGGGKAVLA